MSKDAAAALAVAVDNQLWQAADDLPLYGFVAVKDENVWVVAGRSVEQDSVVSIVAAVNAGSIGNGVGR